jgi:hypothetical protein
VVLPGGKEHYSMKRILGLLVGAASLYLPMVAGAAPAIAAPMQRPAGHLTTIRHDVVSSSNWGGYAVEGTAQFTDVKGTWVEPSVSCPSRSAQYASFWVGIDGYSSNSVEQLGTDSDCTGKGHASYYAWWEMYPASSVSLSTSTYPVSPGDTLTGEVSVSGTSFTLSLKSSRGWTFTTTESGSGLAQSSAEWIAESPEICRVKCSLAQLADFGTMSFTSGSATVSAGTSQPISAFTTNGGPHEIVCETSSGVVRAQPSALGSGGNSFSMTWEHD